MSTAKEEDLQMKMVFAFRNSSDKVDLSKIAPFQKIVQNYLEMAHELED